MASHGDTYASIDSIIDKNGLERIDGESARKYMFWNTFHRRRKTRHSMKMAVTTQWNARGEINSKSNKCYIFDHCANVISPVVINCAGLRSDQILFSTLFYGENSNDETMKIIRSKAYQNIRIFQRSEMVQRRDSPLVRANKYLDGLRNLSDILFDLETLRDCMGVDFTRRVSI